MNIMEKYRLFPEDHLGNGDDWDWEDSNGRDRQLAEAFLTRSCVVGIECYPMFEDKPEPASAGVTYREGFTFFTVVLRGVVEDETITDFPKRPTQTCPAPPPAWEGKFDADNTPTTRVHRLVRFWATVTCYGPRDLAEILSKAQRHPDEEEENR